MTTLIKAKSADEFLSLVPQLLGFHPTRSLVLVPFQKKRTLGAMRVDLPSAVDSAELDRLASTFVGMLCRIDAADGVAVITYTDEPFADDRALPHRALVDALLVRIEACGLRLTDALCVAADAWGSYLDPSCPAGGYALAELGMTSIEAPGVEVIDGDQSAGAELPRVDLAARERAGRALSELHGAIRLLVGDDQAGSGAIDEPPDEQDPPRVNPQALVAVCALNDMPTLFEEALWWDADDLAPYDVAVLAWCLARPALRDVALSQWTKGFDAGDEALDAQLRWEDSGEYPQLLAQHMWGEGAQPDADRLRAALQVSRRIAAVVPRAVRPGPLATCAWLAWALGQSTHAMVYAQLACEIEPEHGLAAIVASLVADGRIPDWSFHRSAQDR